MKALLALTVLNIMKSVLGCDAMHYGRKAQVFVSNLFPPSVVSCRWTQLSSKSLGSTYQATRHHVLEGSNILFTSSSLDEEVEPIPST